MSYLLKILCVLILFFYLHDDLIAQCDYSESDLITAIDGDSQDYFGISVDIDGDYAVVGAYNDDDNGNNAGAVYVYQYSNGEWQQMAKLLASDGNSNDYFGSAVSIDDNYIIASSPLDDDNENASGSVYVFYNNSGIWTEIAKLTASDGDELDKFGNSVSINGNTIAVGTEEDDDDGTNSGSAYVFEKPTSGWVDMTETAKLNASDAVAGFKFGSAVSVFGDVIVVGAPWANSSVGSAYAFQKPISGWTNMTQTAKLTPGAGSYGAGKFGCSVDIYNSTIIVGAYNITGQYMQTGAAFIFQKPVSGWQDMDETEKLVPEDPQSYCWFGYSVHLYEDNALITSPKNEVYGNFGNAYIFTNNGSNWVEKDRVCPSYPDEFDDYGYSCAITEEHAIIAASRSNNYTGSTYIYSKPVIYDQPDDFSNSCYTNTSIAQFVCNTNGATNWQWQMSTDNGVSFQDVIPNYNIPDVIYYWLSIQDLSSSMNGYLFRCIAYNTFGSDTSDVVSFHYGFNSYNEINETVCNNYISPSGNYNWSTSGTYLDTVLNSTGCDSIITIHLTVNDSYSSISEVACDSYTAPDGVIYTESGIETAIIPNSQGCDSIITIDLTIITSTNSSITDVACNSYTAPDGVIYTESGIETAIIPNAQGCDSIITIDLTVNSSTYSSITKTVCSSYTAPDGIIYTESGIETAIIPNAQGCDSIITIDLTVNASYSTISETVCSSYTAPDGVVYTESGIITAIIPNTQGCDSTITINLTVNDSYKSITEVACDSYTAPDGTIYTESGIETAIIPNTQGCDSIITIDLTINNSSSSMLPAVACNSYTAPDGVVYTESGIETAIIPNAQGCDSIITIGLTVSIVDLSVSLMETTLTANAEGVLYQWIDCDNSNIQIEGETNQSFTPYSDGNYAVIIDNGICVDTSICYSVIGLGVEELDINKSIQIYPNPTSSIVTIKGNNLSKIELINITGQKIKTIVVQKNHLDIDLSDYSKGLYFLNIMTNKGIIVKKVIVE